VYDAPPLIPSINAKIALNKKTDVRLSYARGFRAPILRELYFNFFDANHSIQGNPDLKAETSNSYMASISHNYEPSQKLTLSSSIAGFYNSFKNFIDLYGFRDANNNDVFSCFNRNNHKTVGGTFENNLVWKKLTANIGASYIGYYNEYRQNETLKGDRSAFAWSPEINANIAYQLTKLKAASDFITNSPAKYLPIFKIIITKSCCRKEMLFIGQTLQLPGNYLNTSPCRRV